MMDEEYLISNGWIETCKEPGAIQVWEKTFADGRRVLADARTATEIQKSLGIYQCPAPAAT